MSQATVVIRARGHPNITANHAKTFEITPHPHITWRATCVVGVDAKLDWDALSELAGPVDIVLEAGGVTQTVHADVSPFWGAGESLVVRKSDFRGDDTLAIRADAAAADLDRALVDPLKQPETDLTLTIRPVGNRPETVVATNRREHPAVMALRADALVPTPGLLAAAEGADEFLARPGVPAVAAALALLGVGDEVLALGPLPKGATARKALLAAALQRTAAVLVTDLDVHVPDRPFATVVDDGEAVVTVRRGEWPSRLPEYAKFVAVVRGDGPKDDDHRDLIEALLAEGVSARTVRDAIGRLPHLAARWDYDALHRLRDR